MKIITGKGADSLKSGSRHSLRLFLLSAIVWVSLQSLSHAQQVATTVASSHGVYSATVSEPFLIQIDPATRVTNHFQADVSGIPTPAIQYFCDKQSDQKIQYTFVEAEHKIVIYCLPADAGSFDFVSVEEQNAYLRFRCEEFRSFPDNGLTPTTK